tara:strand:- start:56 stop:436 length:381 start_codon:yes stop_codon:yes gene_type:complete
MNNVIHIGGQQAKKVADLNDQLRKDMFTGNMLKKHNLKNKLVITPGIKGYNLIDKEKIFASVKYYGNFTKDNNPYGEKDFGSFNFKKQKFFWKIDYYDNDMKMHSPDKTDPNKTSRVLTVMKAEEY